MAGPITDLFVGVSPSPFREVLADLVAVRKHYDRVVLPCAGRWGVASIMVAQGIRPQTIEASDVCLVSSVVGALVDPDRDLDQLEVTVPDRLGRFTAAPKDRFEAAAGILMAQKFLSLSPRLAYMQAMRDELWANLTPMRVALAAQLQAQCAPLTGARYTIADCRQVLADVTDQPGVFCYVGFPTYKGGYVKLFAAAERQLWDCRLDLEEFLPEEVGPSLLAHTGAPVDTVAYLHGSLAGVLPDTWTKIAALDTGKGRVDWLVANHDTGLRLATARGQHPAGRPKTWPIYADQPITPDSIITFANVDPPTGLHLRDLFVHKLGVGRAERYIVMLIDGRVAGIAGLHVHDLMVGKKPWSDLVFAVGATSDRYARLPKLLLMCMTTTAFRTWALQAIPELQANRWDGLQSSTPSPRHEVKVDRGAMKLISRTPIKGQDGMFRLLSRGVFRDETFTAALGRWHGQWAGKARPGWVDPDAQPAPAGAG